MINEEKEFHMNLYEDKLYSRNVELVSITLHQELFLGNTG